MAASKSTSVARRRQASARSGAASPRAAFFTAFSASSQKPGAAAIGARSRSGAGSGGRVGGEGDGAGAEVAVHDRSTRPSSSAFGAFTGLPVVTRSTAAAGATSRGRRTVPPAPGTMPRVTSGRPTEAEATATRKRQASATSKPPPRAEPWIAAIQGFRRRLDAGDEVGQVRRHRRLAELGDVGAGDEGAAAQTSTTASTSGSASRVSAASQKDWRRAWRECVDRRVVDGDDGDAAFAGDGQGQVYGLLLVSAVSAFTSPICPSTNRCAPACRGPTTFTHLVCAWGIRVIPSAKRESGMDLALGRFGDRRLEKGGPICWRGWWRMGHAACGCGASAEIGRARSASPGSCATLP